MVPLSGETIAGGLTSGEETKKQSCQEYQLKIERKMNERQKTLLLEVLKVLLLSTPTLEVVEVLDVVGVVSRSEFDSKDKKQTFTFLFDITAV